jgi:1,2-diacylglycerol 3-beta-galactosyltransferase
MLQETRQPAVIRQELGWHQHKKTILVVGSKRVKRLEEVLRVFNHSALPVQIVVIAGGDGDLYGRLKRTDWHADVHLYNYVENMPTLMHAADIIVSKAGGLIVTESLACGRPLLMVDVTPGQEEGNAEYVVVNGAGLLAKTPAEALEHLFHWIQDPALLEKYQERAQTLGRPHAAFAVADMVWSAAESGPHPGHQESSPVFSKVIDLLASFGLRSEEGVDGQLPHNRSIISHPGF